MKSRNERRTAELKSFDEFADAVAHFLGGFVRKRYRQDVARPHATLGDQICDAMCDHASLARTRAGQNQQRPVAGGYCLALRWIELREKFSHENVSADI